MAGKLDALEANVFYAVLGAALYIETGNAIYKISFQHTQNDSQGSRWTIASNAGKGIVECHVSYDATKKQHWQLRSSMISSEKAQLMRRLKALREQAALSAGAMRKELDERILKAETQIMEWDMELKEIADGMNNVKPSEQRFYDAKQIVKAVAYEAQRLPVLPKAVK